MAIPNGTKFHGVAPFVDTENRGSSLVNKRRDVYTYPDDFSITVMSNGTFVNFGTIGDAQDVLGGASVDWGVEQKNQGEQFPFLIMPFRAKIVSVGCQWGSEVDYQTARGSSTITFKISQAALGSNMTDAASWTQVGTLTTQWDGTSGSSPGFLEENVDISVDGGYVMQVTAVPSPGFVDVGEEVEITILLEKV